MEVTAPGAILSSSSAPAGSDRITSGIVWGVWLALTASLVWGMARWSSPIPLAEDWLMVAPLTGHEPDLAQWLWAQVNEHRVPVPRGVLLGLLRATHGDFRAGGFFSIAVLAAMAATAILTVRGWRGGRTEVADAFFPMLLLHFGHASNLLMGWQVVFVVPTAVILVLVIGFCAPRPIATRGAVAAVAVGVALLPFCGANGLLFVPGVGVYAGWVGWCMWRAHKGWRQGRAAGGWLMAASACAAIVGALYFVGYAHPWWNPPNPGIVPSAKVTLKVLALGLGPGVGAAWKPWLAVATASVAVTAWVALRAIRERRGGERAATWGAVVIGLNLLGFVALIGWVRAGYVPMFGIPIRYALLGVPVWCAVYLFWERFASGVPRRIAQGGLAAIALVLLPFNLRAGYTDFARWYHEGMTAVRTDLDRGLSVAEVASRHQGFLVHPWTPERLAEHMRFLEASGVAPFNRATTKQAAPKRGVTWD